MTTDEAMAFLARLHLLDVFTDIMREYTATGVHHPITRFAANGGPSWRTRYLRIHDLEQAGLIEFDKGGQYNPARIVPTKLGKDVYGGLCDIALLLEGVEL